MDKIKYFWVIKVQRLLEMSYYSSPLFSACASTKSNSGVRWKRDSFLQQLIGRHRKLSLHAVVVEEKTGCCNFSTFLRGILQRSARSV